MNIFASDPDPFVCAANLDDKRVVKMCLETAQLLSTATPWLFPNYNQGELYKPAYVKHPCSLWAKASIVNFCWLVRHGLALCKVYTDVYGKVHASEELIRKLDIMLIMADLLSTPRPTEFANCTRNESAGVDFKNVVNTHTAYKMYLNARWARDKRKPTWTNRNVPEWYRKED